MSDEAQPTPEAAHEENEPREEVEPAAEAEPVETAHAPVEVGLQRSVRIGRIMIGGAILGAIVGVIIALVFPVAEGANYELRQAVGVSLAYGGAIGLALGSLLALLLGVFAKRNRGEAIAVQTDVR